MQSPALGPKSQNRTAGTASVVDDDDEFGIEAFDFDDDDLDASGTFAKSGSARADLPTEEDLAAAEVRTRCTLMPHDHLSPFTFGVDASARSEAFCFVCVG